MSGNDGSRIFGQYRPYKRHIVRGSGGVQAEIQDLRKDVELTFCAYEVSGQLSLYHQDVVDPVVTDDATTGFTYFSRWINTTLPTREFVCLDPTPGAAVWKETTGVFGGGAVTSVFGRTGAVIAAVGDYLASQVTNNSLVAGATVRDALNTLIGLIPPPAPVTSVFGRTGVVMAAAGDYPASKIINDSTVTGAFVDDALSHLDTTKVETSLQLDAGNGLVGGGDLTVNRSFAVGAAPDGSIMVLSDHIKVGVLATDAQHGNRGGGGLHTTATTVSNGFMSFLDKGKLDSVQFGAQVNAVTSVFGRTGAVVGALNDYSVSLINNDSTVPGATAKDALNNLQANKVPTTRQIISGGGLSGGGDLTVDRTLNVVAHPDGSIVVNPTNIQVGVLASDSQHGLLGGGSLHALATVASAGFMSAVDKLKLDAVDSGITSPWQLQVIDKDLTAPPVGPLVGDRYIIAAPATGAWAGEATHITSWNGVIWVFVTPTEGYTTYVLDEDRYYTFLSGAWVALIVESPRQIISGAGLTGGGDLSTDRTFNVGAHADGSIVVNANDVQVGILATDAQHGVRGGGTQHALVVPAGAAGFMSGADKTKLDGIEAGADNNTVDSVFSRIGAVVAVAGDYSASEISNDSSVTGVFVSDALNTLWSRDLIAGAGLTGGGTLSADRTFNVVAHADGSIVVNANDIQVGVLATDAQHGVRGGGTQHAVVTTLVNGFMSAADKTKLDGVASGAAALTAIAPVDVTKAAAVVGVGTTAARHDHKHDVATAAAVTVAQANSEGTATSLARSDHVHSHGDQPLGDGLDHAAATANPGGVAGFMTPAMLDSLNLHKTVTKFFAITSNSVTNKGSYATISVGSNGALNISFEFPEDYVSLVSLEVTGIPAGTFVNQDIDFLSQYAAGGELFNTHAQSSTTGLYSGTVDVLFDADISSLFTSAAAGDHAGIQIDHNAIGTSILYIGVNMIYLRG